MTKDSPTTPPPDASLVEALNWFVKYMAGKAEKPPEYAFLLPHEIAKDLLKKYKALAAHKEKHDD